MSFNPRNGRFYPRISIGRRAYFLGTFASAEKAAAAYESARMRVRRGEPVLLPKKEKPSTSDIGRFYTPAIMKFGDREGEMVVQVDADQKQSAFLLHNALNDLHPKVKKFVIAASSTGDLADAAVVAGLSQEQVAAVLPRLKVYLERYLQ